MDEESTPITFYVTLTMKENIKKRAAKLGLDLSGYMRWLVVNDLEKNRE